jgi:hypothetical protein
MFSALTAILERTPNTRRRRESQTRWKSIETKRKRAGGFRMVPQDATRRLGRANP